MTDPNDPVALTAAMDAARAATQAFGAETTRTLSGVASEYRRAGAGGRDFGRALSGAFDDVALKGKSLGDALKNLALDLSRMALGNVAKSIGTSIGNSVGNGLSGLVANADGNVVAGGRVMPFAKGGVVASPMLFPLRGGTGLMGEAGAEAIMPLARGSDGRLGVAANGGGSAPNIVFNVTAQDADSFRRSETQIAAMMARVAARGQRNM
tara:strand:- start:210100 stop:210729 length:630 start_codon:yes stop_codon:yes gene_type:complete